MRLSSVKVGPKPSERLFMDRSRVQRRLARKESRKDRARTLRGRRASAFRLSNRFLPPLYSLEHCLSLFLVEGRHPTHDPSLFTATDFCRRLTGQPGAVRTTQRPGRAAQSVGSSVRIDSQRQPGGQ